MRILVVEDEKELCEAVAEGLELSGYAVDRCGDGRQALELLLCEPYDLVILDLNLPGMDGLEVLRRVRAQNKTLRVLVLSARDTVSDKVEGLDLGANDYLTKPFFFRELCARVRNLQRQQFVQADTVLRCGALTLDTAARTAQVQGSPLELTRKELAILEYMMQHPGRVISQEELMEHVWNMQADSFSNAVRVHIASLRRKIRALCGRDLIATRIGQGYCLQEEDR